MFLKKSDQSLRLGNDSHKLSCYLTILLYNLSIKSDFISTLRTTHKSLFRIQFIQKQTEQVLVLALIICLKIDLSA